MLLFISPAKSLDFESAKAIGDLTTPYFINEAQKVNAGLKKKSRKALMEMQGISRPLAELNYNRNQIWKEDNTEIAQAVMAFNGDVYLGMEASKWSVEDMSFAVDHLYILSGLYGLLRPSDAIKAYRLEMGTKIKIGRRENLYKFWSDKINKYFKAHIDSEALIVNLASNEYFKAIRSANIKNPVVNVEFKDYSNGDYKVLSFFAKKARGMMANYIIQNKISSKEDMRGFNVAGYYFDAKSSTEEQFIFLRDKQENEN